MFSGVSPSVGALGRADAYWVLNLCPAAGEGSGAFVPSLRPSSRGIRGAAVNPLRAREEASRRARSQVRRYCAANGLDRFGTLTYAGGGQHDPRAMRGEVGDFFRRLRLALGGQAFPYLWVPEWHKTGHGLHVHFAVGQYIDRRRIDDAWGHGFIKIKRIGDLPHGAGQWEHSRVASRYLAKYVGKDLDVEHLQGLHRYDVAQGFRPRIVQFRATSREHIDALAASEMGAAPDYCWTSDEVEGWMAPPALWYSWR